MDRTLSQAAAPAAELARAFVSRAAALYDRLPQEPTVRPTDPDALARLEARSIPTQGVPWKRSGTSCSGMSAPA